MDFDNCWNAVVKPSNAMRQSLRRSSRATGLSLVPNSKQIARRLYSMRRSSGYVRGYFV
jgi:hypothetical protein